MRRTYQLVVVVDLVVRGSTLSDATFPPCIVPCTLRDFSSPVSVRCSGLVGVWGWILARER